MDDRATPDWLARCDLPRAWGDQAAWTVLDTNFGNAQCFVQCWRTWRQDLRRPRMLHYVGITPCTPHAEPLAAMANGSEDAALWQALAAQCAERGTGFHRILLDQGRVSLTLCVGELRSMLKEQLFLADTVRTLGTGDAWEVQWLARRCKRGARVWVDLPPSVRDIAESALRAQLRSAGFACDAPPPIPPSGLLASLTGRFDPHWEIATRRSPLRHASSTAARCAIIGAGISGASVAHALAVRGWQVTVMDQERAPAGAASGLPVGLAVAHASVDDSPRSRLSRSGTRLAMQHAQQHLDCGQDWEHSGVLECKPGAAAQWHHHAAWIKPAALVRAWLSHPGITVTALTPVGALRRVDGLWHLRNPQGDTLGVFEQVVIANALGCKALLRQTLDNNPDIDWDAGLLDKLNALQALHGTLSHGTYTEDIANLPTTPVNGNGCFFPRVPGAHGMQWACGSTFETDALAAADLGAQHATNLQRLQALLPALGSSLVQALDRGPVSLWSSTRCVTHDRLPLVGSADAAGSGLWLSVGMGARGLSLAPLCAELLVARMGAEPLPVESTLARSLDVRRVRRTRSTLPGGPLSDQTL